MLLAVTNDQDWTVGSTRDLTLVSQLDPTLPPVALPIYLQEYYDYGIKTKTFNSDPFFMMINIIQ